MNENEVIRTKCGGNEKSDAKKVTVNPDGSYCVMLHSDGSMTDLSHLCGATTAGEQAEPAIPANWISVDTDLPKGECLAIYVTPNGKQRMIRAKYARQFQIEAEDDDCAQEYNEADDTYYIKAGWLECIDNWGEYSSCYVTEGTVTLWTPLPLLPGASQAAPAAPEQTPMVEKVRAAMRRAYDLGQTYWQQADSEYTSQNKKADVTAGRFIELTDDICAQLAAPGAAQVQAEPTARENIDQLLAAAQKEYRWGGGEDADGNLQLGYVDFGALRAEVSKILAAPIAAAPTAPEQDERARRFESKLDAVWANLRAMVEKHSGKPCDGEPLDALDALLATKASPAAEQVQTDAARNQALEDEVARLKQQLEKKHKSHFIASQALHNQIVGNQAAWIEWKHGAGAEAAMTWIHNGLVGPGLIPDGKEAQPWFNENVDDRYEIPPMKDGAMKTATNEGEA